MLASDLEFFSIDQVNKAWKTYRTSARGSRMPTVGQIAELIEDGNPSAQIAWNLIPRDEESSVVWSEEMRKGYEAAYPQIREGNITGAFFAFKETYEREVMQTRVQGKKVKWSPSFGYDKSLRETAVIQAVDQKRIDLGLAVRLLPELEQSPQYPRLYLEFKSSDAPVAIAHDDKNKTMALVKDLAHGAKNI